MAELALVASVLQVADVGFRLSVTLYTFGQTVASADDSIVFISKDISHTCSILKTLGQSLEKDREAQLHSPDVTNSVEAIVKECLEIFHEMDTALSKKITRMGLDGSSNRVAAAALERLKWPFLKPKMMLLWGNLGKMKSSLQLMLSVFIYARLLVERREEASVVNDQRSTIEDLLRQTAEQSRKYESLKAAMHRNEDLEIAGSSTSGRVPVPASLEAAVIPTQVLTKENRIEKPLGAPEVVPATIGLEGYCTLIENLVTQVEAKEYNIGHEMRCRIRDDVVHTHKRETQLLKSVHGHTELIEKMRERSWRLVDMAEEKAEEREKSQQEQSKESPSRAEPAPSENSGLPSPGPIDSDRRGRTEKHTGHLESTPENVHMSTIGRIHAPINNFVLEKFLNNHPGKDPWSPLNMRTTMLAWPRILSVDPFRPYIPFLRSGTSVLVTSASHAVESITPSQDLPAFTDSTDTETYVSAKSEVDDSARDSNRFCLVEGELDENLPIIGDQGFGDLAGKGGEEVGSNEFPPLVG